MKRPSYRVCVCVFVLHKVIKYESWNLIMSPLLRLYSIFLSNLVDVVIYCNLLHFYCVCSPREHEAPLLCCNSSGVGVHALVRLTEGLIRGPFLDFCPINKPPSTWTELVRLLESPKRNMKFRLTDRIYNTRTFDFFQVHKSGPHEAYEIPNLISRSLAQSGHLCKV